jgi:hypothetical protein
MNTRANALADRLLSGAKMMEDYALSLSSEDWNKPVKGDGRSVGVVVHHVASVYPIEIELARVLANGNPITEVTKQGIDEMNADHASENDGKDMEETLDLLRTNSRAAADAIRAFSDEELDNAANVSLYFNAPLTAQFFIEDHALRHSYHHLGKIKESF